MDKKALTAGMKCARGELLGGLGEEIVLLVHIAMAASKSDLQAQHMVPTSQGY